MFVEIKIRREVRKEGGREGGREGNERKAFEGRCVG